MRVYTAVFAVVVLASCGSQWPLVFDFARFAFGDAGWAVTVDRLLDDGLVPTKDFAYFYGLLTLVVDRGMFALFGASAETVGGLFVVCAALQGFGVWRLARVFELGPWPRVPLLLAVPLLANPGLFPSPAHALEPVFLTHAIAALAANRIGQSLALLVPAVLIKPGLAYLFGAGVLLIAVLVPGGSCWRRLLPAVGVAAALVAALLLAYGPVALWETQVPLTAATEYGALNYGFFHGEGQTFWKPQPGRHWVYYLVTPAGAWLAASAVLVLGGIAAASRCRSDPTARAVMLMAVLHVAFVCFLYGNHNSWFYYPVLPFVGALAVLDRLPTWQRWRGVRWMVVLLGLTLAVALSTTVMAATRSIVRKWQEEARGEVTGWLFAPPQTEAAWRDVRAAAADGGVFVVSRMGCAWALAPGIEPSRVWYLSRVVATPGDLDRYRAGIVRCRWLVVPDRPDGSLMTWPELADVLGPFRKMGRGPGFDWYRRVESPPK